jgi:hypothetical protein
MFSIAHALQARLGPGGNDTHRLPGGGSASLEVVGMQDLAALARLAGK